MVCTLVSTQVLYFDVLVKGSRIVFDPLFKEVEGMANRLVTIIVESSHNIPRVILNSSLVSSPFPFFLTINLVSSLFPFFLTINLASSPFPFFLTINLVSSLFPFFLTINLASSPFPFFLTVNLVSSPFLFSG